jgi:uncharacterized protein (TIGR02646 family)
MRPIRRGASPRSGDYSSYQAAKPDLVGRLGSYCSFCERFISTGLHVEHIQPKALPPYAHLIGRWDNFLLACINCNSTKSTKDVVLSEILLPDRDNTFAAYVYNEAGEVDVSPLLEPTQLNQTRATLALMGLQRSAPDIVDANGRLIPLDRIKQRLETWLIAMQARETRDKFPDSDPVAKTIVNLALKSGFFSVWMEVFCDELFMRTRLIDAFASTRDSGCFDPQTSATVQPAPNPDLLPHGSKL